MKMIELFISVRQPVDLLQVNQWELFEEKRVDTNVEKVHVCFIDLFTVKFLLNHKKAKLINHHTINFINHPTKSFFVDECENACKLFYATNFTLHFISFIDKSTAKLLVSDKKAAWLEKLNRNHIEFKNCYIENNTSSGIYFSDIAKDNIDIINNDII